MKLALLLATGFIFISTQPVLAEDNANQDSDSVFTYDTDLYNDYHDIDDDDDIYLLDSAYEIEGDDSFNGIDKSYNTELYNRGEYEPDDSNPRIIADPDDVIELDGNARIITDDDDTDIYIINE